jgi:hypothetical protein
MGDVQDTEVFLGALNEYMQRRRAPVSDAFVPVRQELARRRAMLIGEFMQSADELFDFWAGAVRLGGGKKP